MKNKIVTLFITLTSIITAILLLCTTLLGVVYTDFSSPKRFISGICDNLDIELICADINKQMYTCSKVYGFDNSVPIGILENIDVETLTHGYLWDYYNAFISGSDIPTVTLDPEVFYNAISENTDKSTRPEVYKLEENRRALAEKYALCVTMPISSLSANILKSTLTSASDVYNAFVDTGKYFVPCAISFAVFFIANAALIIIFKRRNAAYFTSLAYFIVTLLVSVPFAYLAKADLPARFNVKIGASFAYLDAIYKYLFCTNTFIIISIIAFVLFLGMVLWNTLSNKKTS